MARLLHVHCASSLQRKRDLHRSNHRKLIIFAFLQKLQISRRNLTYSTIHFSEKYALYIHIRLRCQEFFCQSVSFRTVQCWNIHFLVRRANISVVVDENKIHAQHLKCVHDNCTCLRENMKNVTFFKAKRHMDKNLILSRLSI